jgi:hypothetical protein
MKPYLDIMPFLIVENETFSGSLESYRGLLEVQSRRNLNDYEKLSESNVSIDGRPRLGRCRNATRRA